MIVEKDVFVTMRDGVRISLSIYRPDTTEPVPALFAASPYQYEFDDVPAYPLFLWRETGPVAWYVSKGYAYVHADVRGSGPLGRRVRLHGPDRAAGLLRTDRLDLPRRTGATARSAASASPTTPWRSG